MHCCIGQIEKLYSCSHERITTWVTERIQDTGIRITMPTSVILQQAHNLRRSKLPATACRMYERMAAAMSTFRPDVQVADP